MNTIDSAGKTVKRVLGNTPTVRLIPTPALDWLATQQAVRGTTDVDIAQICAFRCKACESGPH